MRTLDIVKSGIDRNFLRECERQKLINPTRFEGEDIVNENYKPREYSQKDLEVVWNAYLYRKIGLPYEQIKQLLDGKEISIRDSAIDLIQKYENQIEELQLLIDFLKYIKCVGVIPTPPESLMESKNFRDYLADFIKHLDPDKKLKAYLSVAEYMAETPLSGIEEEKMDEIIATISESNPNVDDDDMSIAGEAYAKLSKLMDRPVKSPEVQEVIHILYNYQKKLANNPNLTVWDFASQYMFMLSLDSDIKRMFSNALSEKFLRFFEKALLEFLIIEEPEKIKLFRQPQ